MTSLKALVKDRRLEIDVPAEWPDGTEVEICPTQVSSFGNEESISPQEIAETLAAMSKVEPMDLTEAEQAAWEAELHAQKQREKAMFAENAARLRSMWQ